MTFVQCAVNKEDLSPATAVDIFSARLGAMKIWLPKFVLSYSQHHRVWSADLPRTEQLSFFTRGSDTKASNNVSLDLYERIKALFQSRVVPPRN